MPRPPKLQPGDEIRVLAFSRSLGAALRTGVCTEADIQFATSILESLGLRVTFGQFVRECNEHLNASIEHRLEDFHDAIRDPNVKAILAVSGGVGAVQMLEQIDYALLAANPKILCGYSDIAYLCNAIYAGTGLVTYYGPNFSSFMMRQGGDYTVGNFRQRLFSTGTATYTPSEQWSDDAWPKNQDHREFLHNDGLWSIHDGEARGAIVGGNCWCLNMLQGSVFYPSLRDSIVFLEQPSEGKATLMALDSGLRALTFQPDFDGVGAIVIGRYARNSGVTPETLAAVISNIPRLKNLPIIANCDFGHTTPMTTIPIGERCHVSVANGKATITINH